MNESSFVYRCRNLLLIIYFIGGAVFTIEIESVFNGGFYFSIRLLWLPVALLIFGFIWFNRNFFCREPKNRWKVWVLGAVAYPVLLLMSWPYVMVINAITNRGEKIVYSGPIQRKWISGARSKACVVELMDVATSKRIAIIVPAEKYVALSKGANYSTEFARGGLGIPYRWRFLKH